MNKTDHFIYCENNEVQAISLNYKEGDKLETLIKVLWIIFPILRSLALDIPKNQHYQ